jgi:LysM repeat protein
MFPIHSVRFAGLLAAACLLLTACGDNPVTPPQATPAIVATPDPRLATPVTVLADEPLQGAIPEIPSIFIVPSRQPKVALATFLKTTVEQLDYVNPGLPDPVVPGTLVAIPLTYRPAGETLAEVAQKTGVPEATLRAANPKLAEGEALEGKILAMPAIYIVPADTLLSSTVDTLQTSQDALLSANPELSDQEEIRQGTVLVVPPESEQR